MSTIADLQAWYLRHCDGEWEEQYGVKIDTLDNPGWEVTIDLVSTELQDLAFVEVRDQRSSHDWICCRVENNQFQGFGGPLSLERILEVFMAWSNQTVGLRD